MVRLVQGVDQREDLLALPVAQIGMNPDGCVGRPVHRGLEPDLPVFQIRHFLFHLSGGHAIDQRLPEAVKVARDL
jgi:hypothetical protein